MDVDAVRDRGGAVHRAVGNHRPVNKPARRRVEVPTGGPAFDEQ